MGAERTDGDTCAVRRTGLPLVAAAVLSTTELCRPVSAGEPPPNAAAVVPPPSNSKLLVGLNQARIDVIRETDGRGVPVAPESLIEARGTVLGSQIWTAEPVEVLAPPDHLAHAAVDALGWDGVVLPPMVLLGRRVVAVANLIADVHQRRISSGWGPVTDRLSVSTWDWPEMRHLVPAPAVELSGIIAPARHWRTGLTGAAPFVGLCPTALLLPAHIARNVECLTHAEYYGPTVLAAAGPDDVDPEAVDVVHAGRSRAVATAQPTKITRWIYEMVYDRLVKLH
jgi:hypothetical protein